jgi:hypothetical protein
MASVKKCDRCSAMIPAVTTFTDPNGVPWELCSECVEGLREFLLMHSLVVGPP